MRWQTAQGPQRNQHRRQGTQRNAHHHWCRGVVGKHANHTHARRRRDHLDRAQQGRRRASYRTVILQGQHAGCRQQQAEKTETDEQQCHHHGQAVAPHQGDSQHRHHRRHGHHRTADHPRQAKARTQARGKLAHGEERRGVEGKAQAELRGRQAVVLDVHERRAADEHKKGGQAKPADHRQPDKHRVAQQCAVAADGRAEGLAQAPLGRVGFG